MCNVVCFKLFLSPKRRTAFDRAFVISVWREETMETRIALCLSSDSFPAGREKKKRAKPHPLADCKHGRSVVRERDERRR